MLSYFLFLSQVLLSNHYAYPLWKFYSLSLLNLYFLGPQGPLIKLLMSSCLSAQFSFFSSFSSFFAATSLPSVLSPLVVVVVVDHPDDHLEGPASLKKSSGLLQMIFGGTSLLQMIIQRGRPLANPQLKAIVSQWGWFLCNPSSIM